MRAAKLKERPAIPQGDLQAKNEGKPAVEKMRMAGYYETVHLGGEIGSPEDAPAVIANDGLGLLLQVLGEDSELQGSPEYMISLNTDVGMDFIGFGK